MADNIVKTPELIGIDDLALLITSASRLLTNLAAAAPFKNANVGLAEWLSLSVLVDKDGVSNKQLARALGVTGQRTNQLCTSLAKSGLITIQQSPDDNRRNVLKVTAQGKKQVDTLNTELHNLLATALKGREKTLKNAGRHLRLLMRLLLVPSAAKAKQSPSA